MITLRTLVNKPSVVFDALKLYILFAEDWKDISDNFVDLDGRVGNVESAVGSIPTSLNQWLMYTPDPVFDGSQTEFYFDQQPTIVVVDGASYVPNVGARTFWSWNPSTLKVVLNIPAPVDMIFAYK